MGEQDPQGSSDDDAEGDAAHGSDENGHRRLPGHESGQLAVGEPERLDQRQFPPPPTHRGDESQAQGGHGASRQCRSEDGRGATHRPVVDDLSRSLHRQDLYAIVGRSAGGSGDPLEGVQG